MVRKGWLLVNLMVVIMLMAAPAMAHDEIVYDTFMLSDVGEAAGGYIEHNDDSGWKGFVQLTVINTGDTAWDDFHFRIFEFDGDANTDVIFTAVDPDGLQDWTPRSTHTLSDWVMGPEENALDLYFEDDPVYANGSVTFTIYTDNTSETQPMFGIGFFATPVPVPGSIILLFSGLTFFLSDRIRRFSCKCA